MALLKPTTLINHPVRSGLLWTVLFIPAIALLSVLQDRTENLPFVIVLAVPGGIAWGFAMRWWYNRKADRSL